MSGVRISALCRLVSLTCGVSRLESRLVYNALIKSQHCNHFATCARRLHQASAPRRYFSDATSRFTARTNISSDTVRPAATRTTLEITKLALRQAEEVRVGRSIGPVFTSPAIHGWNFSKELRPSGSVVQRTAGNLLTSGFHSSAWQNSCKRGSDDENSTRDPCECVKRPKDLCEESSEKDLCASRDPCEEKQICTEGTSHQEPPDCGGPKPCRSTICDIPRLVCPPPSLRQLYPGTDKKTVAMWRSIVLFVVMPILLVSSYVLISRSIESRKKPRPPFVDAPYLHRRTKAFPWGDGHHSLFHNPRTNGIPPHGYEVPDPYAEKSEE